MKIFIMTDMEGCAGILNHDDWVLPTGRYYEQGQRILTGETNAVIEGLFAGGATEILVCDGHGAGGIAPLLLDERARLQRGWPTGATYPFGLERSFNGLAFVGQHAMSRTDFSHITHTGWFDVLEETINGTAVGEYGQVAYCAAELGVPCIFAGGEEALTKEALALTPAVMTVAVKQGVIKDGLDHLSEEDYRKAKLGAIHLSHAEACRRLKAGARQAASRLKADPKQFQLPLLKPPYVRVMRYRASKGNPPQTLRSAHPNSIIALMNLPCQKA